MSSDREGEVFVNAHAYLLSEDGTVSHYHPATTFHLCRAGVPTIRLNWWTMVKGAVPMGATGKTGIGMW